MTNIDPAHWSAEQYPNGIPGEDYVTAFRQRAAFEKGFRKALEVTTGKSYHDLYVTTVTIPRTSIFNLPFSVQVFCTRVGGWEVWEMWGGDDGRLLGSEGDPEHGLRLDLNGLVIVDSLTPKAR